MPIAALTGEMGWLPVQYRHMIIILKMYINLESNYECDDTLFWYTSGLKTFLC